MEDQHRFFVQYMLKRGTVSEEKALNYCRGLPVPVENEAQLKLLILTINREISQQFFKIVFITCEVTQQRLIVWLNTRNDDISNLQITYSPIELEYFHVILQEILCSDDNKLTSIIVLNITSNLTEEFSRDSGQKILKIWIDGGYFVKKGNFVYLGPRLILEFMSHLKSICPNHICKLCSELVFTGKKCSSCDKLFHACCMHKYLDRQENCPMCKNRWVEWPNELTLGSTEELRNIQENCNSENESMDTSMDTSNIVEQDVDQGSQPSTSAAKEVQVSRKESPREMRRSTRLSERYS
ncbi:non-structural maintenance of chromosomes element 1 homolog isoform X2 [Euwallacea similis]|uniref:non-structural maintenance of chromosomes element 1 homolog isoform X2 n=1 Tax=Euwallacea similis TaxID=1736056 RepID=UPI00344EB4DE